MSQPTLVGAWKHQERLKENNNKKEERKKERKKEKCVFAAEM